MIDIHSHLIFGVDDGSSSLKESIMMIEAAGKQNIDTIIATPHFQSGIFSNEKVLERFEIIVSKALDYQIDLRLGNELFADDDIFNLIKAKKNINFGNSKYLLVELPYSPLFSYISDLIKKLAQENINIIIAHPERNRSIIKNYREFIELIQAVSCKVQIDAGSIIGIYGSFVKTFARRLLKIKVVDFIASNAHSSRDYMTLYPAAVKEVYQICDKEYANKLLESNAREIISAQESAGDYGREVC